MDMRRYFGSTFLKVADLKEEMEAMRARQFGAADAARHTDQGQADLLRAYSLRNAVNGLLDPAGLGGFRVLIQRKARAQAAQQLAQRLLELPADDAVRPAFQQVIGVHRRIEPVHADMGRRGQLPGCGARTGHDRAGQGSGPRGAWQRNRWRGGRGWDGDDRPGRR